ncbi:hypothetical protein HpHNI32_15700 [Helicobacter pylori]
MKDNNQNNHTKEVFQYLSYQTIKGSDTDLSFFDFIQKLEKFQQSDVRNKRVKSYFILLQKKAV